MNEVNYTSYLYSTCTLYLIIFLGAAGWVLPLLFAKVSPFVQAARQDAERAPRGQGPNRRWTSNARPGLAQGQDVRSGL